MSLAGFSMAESVYYEEPYTVPGPCKTCCLRCPCPNLITTILFLIGIATFCTGVVLATDATVNVFLWNRALKGPFSDWFLYVKVGVAVGTAVMAILSILMLAMSYLGTGATRKEFVCRFRTRAKGRCQTALVLTIAYVLLLIWIVILLITLIPTFFFSVQARGICRSARDTQNSERYFYECLDLRQWGLIDYNPYAVNWADPRLPSNEEETFFMCDEDLEEMCASNVLIYYGIALAGAILTVLSLVHYVLNFSANYAKLRDRFKDGYVDKRTGTYLQRTTSLRGSKRSLAGTRASLRGSRGSVRHVNGVSNGGIATPASASTLRIAAYKNDALKSSREDIVGMQDLKPSNANGNYGGSNYGGSNYGGSSVSGSNVGMGSNYGAQEYSGPKEADIDEIPALKAAYMDTFGDPEDSYNNQDRFTSQTSFQPNVPADPYISANMNNDAYNNGDPYTYTKTGAYSNNDMSRNDDAYNDGYGTNLDRDAAFSSKEYGSHRHLADNDFARSNEYPTHASYSGTGQSHSNRNSQGSNNQNAGAFSEPFVSLQSTDSSSRERQEYFI